ncbi:MAG: oligoribonuclease [Micrococcales bacterium]|nr:oligoribonuclease [Micrococcales bacterium]
MASDSADTSTINEEPPPKKKGTPDGRIVWIDCEMTGLDLKQDALVEIACIVTEADLTPLDDGITVVIRPPADALDQMAEVVVEMHQNSGLIEEIPEGISLADAASQVLSYVRGHVPDNRKAPLAGSTIYVDRGFLARDMPALDNHLHYRVIDVSSLKELARRWYPKIYYGSPEKTGNHRAMGDILDSIAELRYYRDKLMDNDPNKSS